MTLLIRTAYISPMPKTSNPCEFTREELLALLHDETVSVEAISEEMETAGSKALPPAQLQLAREVLQDFAPERAEHFLGMERDLRDLLLELAQMYSATELITELAKSADKAVAKQAKRAIHILRSRGVQVAPSSAKAPPALLQTPASVAPSLSPEEPALMSIPDWQGRRTLYLPFLVRGGIDLAYLQISDLEGVLHAEVLQLNRSAYRRALYDFRRGGSFSAPISLDYACGLVQAGLDLNAQARRMVPNSFNDVAFLMGSQRPQLPSPGRAIELDFNSEQWVELVLRGIELYAHPVLRYWPEAMAKRPLTEEFSAILPLIAEGKDLDSPRVHDAIEGQIDGDFDGAQRLLYTERLLDAAAVLHGLNNPELAQIARASAEALERGYPPSSIPFVVGLYSSLGSKAEELDSGIGGNLERLPGLSILEALHSGKAPSDVLPSISRSGRIPKKGRAQLPETAKLRQPQRKGQHGSTTAQSLLKQDR